MPPQGTLLREAALQRRRAASFYHSHWAPPRLGGVRRGDTILQTERILRCARGLYRHDGLRGGQDDVLASPGSGVRRVLVPLAIKGVVKYAIVGKILGAVNRRRKI